MWPTLAPVFRPVAEGRRRPGGGADGGFPGGGFPGGVDGGGGGGMRRPSPENMEKMRAAIPVETARSAAFTIVQIEGAALGSYLNRESELADVL